MDVEQPLSLREIVAVLNRRKRQIVITFLVVVAAVTAVLFLMPKQYEAHMKVLVKNERADTIVSADSNNGSMNMAEVDESQINSEIELLNSNNLLQQVVVKCSLEKLETSDEPAPADRLAVSVEKAVKRLKKKLDIEPVKKSDIIQVDYISPDPRLAAAVLQQLAESYLDEHLKVHGTPGTYQFFSRQASRYQHELTEAEAKLAEFRRSENIVLIEEQKNTLIQKVSDAEFALDQADASIRDYTSQIADTRAQLAAAAPRVVTQSRTVTNQYSVERLGTMLAELQNRRTLLLAKFRPDDRMVLEADQEIADTQAALEKATKMNGVEQATDINLIRQTLEIDQAKQQAELAGLQARRQALARQSWINRQNLMKLGSATSTHDDLVRTQKEAEDNYLLYVKKAEEARIAESLDQQKIANVAIAETPTVPHLPKPILLKIALGVVLAAFLSLGLAFAAEYFSPTPGPSGETVDDPASLESVTGLPVLGIAYRS
jgi:uncharacterized protein involved in exopolysaccharide biosynthesis